MAKAQHYLSPEDLAERYGVPLATIYQWRTKRYGPRGIRVGRHVRFAEEECLRWERERLEETA